MVFRCLRDERPGQRRILCAKNGNPEKERGEKDGRNFTEAQTHLKTIYAAISMTADAANAVRVTIIRIDRSPRY
jgi:hypothetical protein